MLCCNDDSKDFTRCCDHIQVSLTVAQEGYYNGIVLSPYLYVLRYVVHIMRTPKKNTKNILVLDFDVTRDGESSLTILPLYRTYCITSDGQSFLFFFLKERSTQTFKIKITFPVCGTGTRYSTLTRNTPYQTFHLSDWVIVFA